MSQQLDGPSKQGTLSAVGTATPVEVKVGASAFVERQVVTLQSTGKFYIYFADEGVVPNAATVIADGFTQFKDALNSYEATDQQAVYVLAVAGTVDIKLAERA
jgi:hypothetical protein